MSYDELLRKIERALVAIDATKPYRYKPTNILPMLPSHVEAALDAQTEMVAKVLKRARQMESDLDALRDDLREAMELLRAHGQAPQWMRSAGRFDAVEDWHRRYGKLLEKHKEEETP